MDCHKFQQVHGAKFFAFLPNNGGCLPHSIMITDRLMPMLVITDWLIQMTVITDWLIQMMMIADWLRNTIYDDKR